MDNPHEVLQFSPIGHLGAIPGVTLHCEDNGLFKVRDPAVRPFHFLRDFQPFWDTSHNFFAVMVLGGQEMGQHSINFDVLLVLYTLFGSPPFTEPSSLSEILSSQSILL
jgi:hypothetical protein